MIAASRVVHPPGAHPNTHPSLAAPRFALRSPIHFFGVDRIGSSSDRAPRLRVAQCCYRPSGTVTGTLAERLPFEGAVYVIVIVASPDATGVMRPCSSTVATAGVSKEYWMYVECSSPTRVPSANTPHTPSEIPPQTHRKSTVGSSSSSRRGRSGLSIATLTEGGRIGAYRDHQGLA